MLVAITAVALVTLGSGCAAAGMPATRDLLSTPRSEAAWIIAAGVGELALGAALAYGSIQPPEPPDENLSAGDQISQIPGEVGKAFLGLLAGTSLAVLSTGDLLGGLYQLVSNDYLFGEPSYAF